MPEKTISIQTTDGNALSVRQFVTPGARATVLICHGYGEHSGRYLHVVEFLERAGFSVVAFDLRGHGESSGARGTLTRFSEYVDDLALVIEKTRTTLPGPLFLLAHSLGGLIAAHYVSSRPYPAELAGVILSSPFWAIQVKVPPLKAALGRAMSVVWPTLALPGGLSGNLVTRTPEIAAAYDTDPLMLRKIRTRWFTEITAAQAALPEQVKRIQLPLLILAGGDDKIADTNVTETIFRAIGSGDKTWRRLEGQYHEVLNEPERLLTMGEIVSWITAHLTRTAVKSVQEVQQI